MGLFSTQDRIRKYTIHKLAEQLRQRLEGGLLMGVPIDITDPEEVEAAAFVLITSYIVTPPDEIERFGASIHRQNQMKKRLGIKDE